MDLVGVPVPDIYTVPDTLYLYLNLIPVPGSDNCNLKCPPKPPRDIGMREGPDRIPTVLMWRST